VQDAGKQVISHKLVLLAILSGLVLVLSASGYIWLVAFQYTLENSWSQDLFDTSNQPLGRLVVTYPTSLAPGAEDIVTVQLIMTNTTSTGVHLDIDLRSDIHSSTGVVAPYVGQYDLSKSAQPTAEVKIRAGRPSFFSTGSVVLRIETRLSMGSPEVNTIPILVRSGWVQILVIPIALGVLGLVVSSLGHRLLAGLTKRLRLQSCL
jgi:cytoskeletal protein RodZ